MDLSVLEYKESRTLEKKRKEILLSARSLFNREGIEQTSMKMIADEASITRRSLYNYYDSKESVAIDVQILSMKEIDFYKIWDVDRHDNFVTRIVERFPLIVRRALSEQRSHFLFINRFDTYFNKGYPNDKYIRFIRREMEEKFSISPEEIGNSISRQQWIHSNLFLAYLQRLILRSTHKPLRYCDIEDEVNLFCKIMLSSDH